MEFRIFNFKLSQIIRIETRKPYTLHKKAINECTQADYVPSLKPPSKV